MVARGRALTVNIATIVAPGVTDIRVAAIHDTTIHITAIHLAVRTTAAIAVAVRAPVGGVIAASDDPGPEA